MNSKYYVLAAAVVVVIIVALVFMFAQPAPQSAHALYTQSVDLAEAGNYEQALATADKALVLNESSYTALIQTNRAGILVMLGKYEEANAAADAALAIEGNLTTTHSIAWSNKGDALTALGRTAEAEAAYANATALDPSLKHP